MRTERWSLHHSHPHMALHMPHPMHWMHEHQMARVLIVAGLLILLMAGIAFLAYRLGGFSGSDTSLHLQSPLYPYYY